MQKVIYEYLKKSGLSQNSKGFEEIVSIKAKVDKINEFLGV